VSEVLQAGWFQSFPDIPGDGDWDVVLTGGQVDSGNDFGNFQQATKSGTKFNDLDHDGVRDAGEPGLAGWVIHLDGTDGQGIAVNLTDVTDANGDYSFTVNPGTYTVSEEQQAGWTQSGPDLLADAGDNDAGATDGDWDIVLTSGQVDSGNDFGNFQEEEFCFGGLTPGAWKTVDQGAGIWDDGYAPTDSFEDTFGIDVSWTISGVTEDDVTLLEALGLNGGGQNALARHATAALLNAADTASGDPELSNPYPFTQEEIIAAVQWVYGLNSDIDQDGDVDINTNPDNVYNSALGSELHNVLAFWNEADEQPDGMICLPPGEQPLTLFETLQAEPPLWLV
jgi:hypothetical protein